MEYIYNRPKLALYEKRAQIGRRLAYRSQLIDDERRKIGKILRVVPYPQGGGHVPSVRVAGKWMTRFGFEPGDEVILTASPSRIVLIKKEVHVRGHTVV